MDSRNYALDAWAYAKSVIEGDRLACKYVVQACQRFADDLRRIDEGVSTFVFDSDEAWRWCRFLESLPHVKGKWASKGEKLILSDWQIFCTCNIFGFRDKETQKRRFREVYIEVPRKNGKSLWMAGIGLGGLAIDMETGAEVYCGATTEKQAWEVFRPAKLICERTPELREAFSVTPRAKSIDTPDGGRMEPVIGSPGDGPSPSIGIADEFHEHVNSDLVDTFITGMGARDQPLMVHITTSGSDMGGPCYEKRMDMIKVLDGSVEDDRIFTIIYTLDEDDEWDTVDAQKKANPNYGVSVSADFLHGQLEQARRSASKQTAYKTKHLDLWVGAKSAWMNMLAYQRCRKRDITLEAQRGRKCYAALDLASKVDLAAKCYLFPPDEKHFKWMAFFVYYLPEDLVMNRQDAGKGSTNSTRYKSFHAGGHITATPGNIIDLDMIESDIIEDMDKYVFEKVGYDPWQATQLATHISEKGLETIEIRQTVQNFSEPMKEIEAKILKRQIEFSYDPVTMWCFSNTVAKEDKKGNIFPDKESKLNKIDGVVALIMAMRLAIADMGENRFFGGLGPQILEA